MPDRDPGQLTARQLDLYASQLARCLKALGTDAPIRGDVQRELATVRAEQESRASPASPLPRGGWAEASTRVRSDS
jgi:hypothetical protein